MLGEKCSIFREWFRTHDRGPTRQANKAEPANCGLKSHNANLVTLVIKSWTTLRNLAEDTRPQDFSVLLLHLINVAVRVNGLVSFPLIF